MESGDEYFRFYKDGGQITSADSYLKLLLHMNGLEESTTFTDDGGTIHTVTANGDAQIDTAYQKFGTGSGLFDGTGDDLSVPDHADWNFGSGTFTIDFWVKFNAVPATSNHMMFVSQKTNTPSAAWYVSLYRTGGGALQLSLYSTGAGGVVGPFYWDWSPISTGIWYHVAFIRGWGGVANAFAATVNGTQVGSTETDSDIMLDIGDSLFIGSYDGTQYYLNGALDELRISKGIARWTANFTAPTSEYSGSGTPYEVTTPYQAEDVFDLKFTQSADYLYITHPDYPPKTLTRTGHTSWTLADLVTTVDIDNQMDITAITKANPAVVTCTTVPTSLANGDTVYIQDVGGMTEVNDLYFTVASVTTGASGHFQLSGINSSAYTTYTSGGSADETEFGTTDNNPACVTFFEQRLAMASTNNNPQTFWLSASADFDDFTQDADDDSAAIEYTIASNQVDRIRWMVGQDHLFLGTIGGIWKTGASSVDEPITATNITAKKQDTIGVADIAPELVADAVLWVTRAGTSVRHTSYYYLTDKYENVDLVRIASHITIGDSLAESGITQLAFQQEPEPILWAIRADGQLLGMTYNLTEQVYSWFRVVTDGSFESIAVISAENEEDQVWVVVNRTIDGSTARYVEYFMPHEFYGEIEDAFFVHSGLTWDGASKATFTGLDHLEGESVSVLSDGVVLASETVSSGSVTIDTAGTKVHLGLPYTSILEPMKIVPSSESGGIRGKKQRINKILVDFYQTGNGVEFGPSQSNLQDFSGFTSGSLTSDALLETFHGDWDDEATITIQQSDPLPVTILGIIPWMTISPN